MWSTVDLEFNLKLIGSAEPKFVKVSKPKKWAEEAKNFRSYKNHANG